MARPAGFPLLLLLPLMLGCFLGGCRANVIKENLEAKADSVDFADLDDMEVDDLAADAGIFRKVAYDEFEKALKAIDKSYVSGESCDKLEYKVLKLVPAVDPLVKSLFLLLVS